MINFYSHYTIPFFKGRKIINCTLLSKSFGTFCEKIKLDNNKTYIVKGFQKKNNNYDSIYYEGKSLQFMYLKFPNLFPNILYLNKNILIANYIDHNKIKNKNSEKDLAYKIAEIHKVKNNKFGFKFDSPIGGLRQPCKFQKSWIDFFEENRLGMIYNKINKTNPMPKKINQGIEKILKNLKNFIPHNPEASLIHGDLWEGNILFDKGKLVGLIDPGIYYAPKEIELAYLKWFKFISNKFYKYYSEVINFDKDFFNYSEVYELYYSLLNVHLWDRRYINDVAKLISKFI